MGLDVYLYHCKNRSAVRRVVETYERASEAIWEKHLNGLKYNDATKEQRDAARAACDALRAEMGLGKYAQHPDDLKIEMDSKLYPEHLFKVGYFRSSYNEGGINNYLRRVGVPDLYEIVGAPHDTYEFTPEWAACRARAADAIAQLRSVKHADVDVMVVGANPFMAKGELPHNEEQARAIVVEQLEREHHNGFRSYSTANGEFFVDGLNVVGLMPGTSERRGNAAPCVYVAYRRKGEGDWYAQALEIIIETCDHVLAQPDLEHYYVHWSS